MTTQQKHWTFTGRADLDAIFARYQLPPACTAAVRSVVAKARLWPREQEDVARDLAEHFREGLDAGVSESDLLAAFGDPATAASLIRRAKLRARPKLWRAARAAAFASAALLILYAALMAPFFFTTPHPDINYLTNLNTDADATPVDQRAWPLYREAFAALPRVEKLSAEDYKLENMLDSLHPGDKLWPAAVERVHAVDHALQLARQAAAKSHIGFILGAPFDDQPGIPSDNSVVLLSVRLYSLGDMRRLASLIGVDLRNAAATGDRARVLEDLAAMRGISRHVAQTPLLINALVAFSIDASLTQAVMNSLRESPAAWDEPTCAAAATTLGQLDLRECTRQAFRGESLMFRDLVQRVFSGNDQTDGQITLAGLRLLREFDFHSLLPANSEEEGVLWKLVTMHRVAARSAGRVETIREYEALLTDGLAALDRPSWDFSRMLPEEEFELYDQETQTRFFIVRTMMVTMGAARTTMLTRITARDAALMALAAHRVRCREGQWPKYAEQLRPDLATLPRDPFDGQPLRYRLTEDGPVIYSVGEDLVDDLGTPVPSDEAHFNPGRKLTSPARKGDWVLFPMR